MGSIVLNFRNSNEIKRKNVVLIKGNKKIKLHKTSHALLSRASLPIKLWFDAS